MDVGFPVTVNVILMLISIATVIRSRFVKPVPIDYQFKNIALVLGSLVGFVVLSQLINMIVGIVFMVFLSALAAATQSWKRSLIISAARSSKLASPL